MSLLKKQDFILLIMNCQKYRYKAEQQKQSWINQLPQELVYFHVIGDPDLDVSFLFDYKEHILWVKTSDDYNSLPWKVISAYEAVQNTFDYQYIFKTDDDQILTSERFFKMIINLLFKMTPQVHYGGYIVHVDIPHISKYYLYHPELPKNLKIEKTEYCNGRFYLLSAEATENLIDKKNIIKKEYLEDYAIGYHLDSVFKENILSISTNKYFQDSVDTR